MGKQHLKKKIVPKTDFILLSDIVSEAKEKFDGWNLRTQLYNYLHLQSNIYRSSKVVKDKNKIEVKHKLASLLLNGIDTVFSPEARN